MGDLPAIHLDQRFARDHVLPGDFAAVPVALVPGDARGLGAIAAIGLHSMNWPCPIAGHVRGERARSAAQTELRCNAPIYTTFASQDAHKMIRPCTDGDLLDIYNIINDAAHAYRGVIPQDCWKEPYMPSEELREEVAHGVQFWGYELQSRLVGVMGLQENSPASLIRHAYVQTEYRNQGIGGQLLAELRNQARNPLLVGTWTAARWAIAFYEKHGFRLVSETAKNQLLRKFWSINKRQIETSVVLVDFDPARWRELVQS